VGIVPWGFESLHPHPLEQRHPAAGSRSRLLVGVADRVLIHPNREKVESRSTRAAVILLLLTGALLVLVITVGGWSVLEGMQIVSLAFVVIFVVMAYYVGKWNRGVLPVAAALAILVGAIAAISAPAWFVRDKAGFHDPAFDPSLLGLLSVILIPVCLLLIAFAMRGVQQAWNVEVEVDGDEADRYPGGAPRAAAS
jgi:lysylphosphatidylglycerol synthetase-like protein (DUF2156 family)